MPDRSGRPCWANHDGHFAAVEELAETGRGQPVTRTVPGSTPGSGIPMARHASGRSRGPSPYRVLAGAKQGRRESARSRSTRVVSATTAGSGLDSHRRKDAIFAAAPEGRLACCMSRGSLTRWMSASNVSSARPSTPRTSAAYRGPGLQTFRPRIAIAWP